MWRGGYYRFNKKNLTDDYHSLDIKNFSESVDLATLHRGGWQWTSGKRKSSVSYRVEPRQGVQLSYTSNGQDYDYLVRVVTTIPHFGGKRYWWICPNQHCGRRCRILYGGKYFCCRQCHHLTYATAQSGGALSETIDNRLRFIFRKLKGEGHWRNGPPSKPKGMHWKTYSRYACEYMRLVEVDHYAFLDGALALMGGLTLDDGKRLEADAYRELLQADWQALKQDRKTGQQTLDRMTSRLAGEIVDDEEEAESERRNANRLTLGELADRAGVPFDFAREAQAEGLINADRGRGKRRKRYRERLKHWLRKLYALRATGLEWAEIHDWTRRRFKAGHEHERLWPGGATLLSQRSTDSA